MRRAVSDRYGPPEVVRVEEVPDPAPKAGQVLVRVRATPVTSGDARIRAARFPPGFAPFARLAFGVRRPRRPVLGSAFAGEVAALGDGVEGWRVGERVCGMAGVTMGAHAEMLVVPVAKLVRVPDEVTFDDAAGVLFGGTTAQHFVRRTDVGEGSTVLVIGASGAVGTNVVQLAARLGATVTGVCSGANAELVRSLGATDVIDRTVVDVTALDRRFDVVVDTVGVLSIASGRRLLAPDGRLGLVVAGLGEMFRARGRVVAGSSGEKTEDMAALLDLVASGDLRVVIDRTLPLEEVVEAHRIADTGHKVGNLLLHP